MKYKNLIIFSVVALVTIIVVLAYYFSFPEEPSTSSTSYFSQKTEAGIVPPLATGNIDDMADALLKELIDEEFLYEEEEDDVEILISDMQEISDFGQSVDESEL